MAIIVKGANRSRKSEEVIKRIVENGITDSDGNELELITLYSTQIVANAARVHGFQDTEIDARDMSFHHKEVGKAGTLYWKKDSWGSTEPAKAQLAATPFNKMKLAGVYRDGKFKIKEIHLDAEIKAMSDKIREEMTPEERTYDDARIKSLHTLPSGSIVKSPKTGKTVEVDTLEIERQILRKKAIELQKQEDELKVREKKLTKHLIPKFIEAGGKTQTYSRPELESMGIMSIKKIGRLEFGLDIPLTAKKNEVVDMVFQAQETKQDTARAVIEG